jgi:hypothetical protein
MIQELHGRYAFALDYPTSGPDEYANLFTENARFIIPEISMVLEGREDLRKFADGIHKTVPGLHHVQSNFVINIDGDRATGKCELNEFMVRPEAIYNNIHGYYEDTYVRLEGQWYFEQRIAHILSLEVTGNGKIGEYFAEFFEMCQQFIRP